MSISRLIRSAIALAAATATLALAQSPPAAQDPRDMGEANRKVYAEALHAAKDLLDRKQYAEAIEKLDALSAARPRESQARFMKGVALADQGKIDEAITVFRGILADFPELPEPRNNLAVLYAQKGEYAQARDELERAIATAPDYAVAHENLGDVYARLASVEFEKATTLDKRNRSAAAKLKQIRELPAN
ncbi:MAG TPA: tetratricopeptide repeat protein [Casimicrobiaceae bacterium]|nr:tetratricopeptide repeat protein [Casimicrobiaceae bacterium]